MTDGAGLPLALSDLVAELRDRELVDATVTYGHAFGGDYEAVSIFSALAVARHVAGADVAVVAMGPGIVGTNTRLGFSGMEVGPILDAAVALGGLPIACLRVSFADPRARHHGLSHHSRDRPAPRVPRAGARSRCRSWASPRTPSCAPTSPPPASTGATTWSTSMPPDVLGLFAAPRAPRRVDGAPGGRRLRRCSWPRAAAGVLAADLACRTERVTGRRG